MEKTEEMVRKQQEQFDAFLQLFSKIQTPTTMNVPPESTPHGPRKEVALIRISDPHGYPIGSQELVNLRRNYDCPGVNVDIPTSTDFTGLPGFGRTTTNLKIDARSKTLGIFQEPEQHGLGRIAESVGIRTTTLSPKKTTGIYQRRGRSNPDDFSEYPDPLLNDEAL